MRGGLTRFLALIAWLNVASAANIGVFVTPISKSQIVFNVRLAETLASAGHDVTIVLPIYGDISRENFTTHERVSIVRVDALGDEQHVYDDLLREEQAVVYKSDGPLALFAISNLFQRLFVKTCEGMVSDDKFLAELRRRNFDLAFHPHFDHCFMGIFDHLAIPKWIMASPGPPTTYLIRSVGLGALPSIVPNILMPYSTHMTFDERLKNFLVDSVFLLTRPLMMRNEDILMHKYLPAMRSLTEISKKASMVMFNADSLLDYAVPLTNKVQFIGGLGMKPSSKNGTLKDPFRSFVNSHETVVLVSFGSVADAATMPDEWKRAFVELFKANPDVGFIWKQEAEVEVPSNVLRTAWMPQNDILGSERCKAFITHGGYNSLQEAVLTATPIVAIPLFVDQPRNARLAEHRGFGVVVEKSELSGETLNAALQRVLKDGRYTEAAKVVQRVLNSKQHKPEETLIYWTQFVLDNPAFSMDLPELNLFQFYCLDVVAFLIAVAVVVLYLLYRLLRLYYWSCCTMAYKEKIKLQ